MKTNLTKQQMIEEIMFNCKWSATAFETNVKRGCRNNLEYVEKIYNSYLKDVEHYRFYAELLAR